MNTNTSVSISNRSLESFLPIVQAITHNHYSELCQLLQKNIQNIYEFIYGKKYQETLVEYQVQETESFWLEILSFKERCHTNSFLTINLDNSYVPESQEKQAGLTYRRAQHRIYDYFSDEEFSHVLLTECLRTFLLCVIDTLKQTHHFTIEADEGVLIFKATPYKGHGVLSLVSRSQEAVLAADINTSEQLRQMGYIPHRYVTAIH